VNDRPGRGRDTVFLDANGDGWDDLFVGNEPGRVDDLPSLNHLYINTQAGYFRDATAEYGIDPDDGGTCVTTADVNGDGFVDLYVCNHLVRSRGTGGHLYINDQGQRFIDQTSLAGLESLKPVDAEFGDVDGDGDPDLAVAEAGVYHIRENVAGVFSGVIVTGDPAPMIRDLAIGDVDADGDLDLYVVTDESDILQINNGPTWEQLPSPDVTSGQSEEATMIPNWDGRGRAAIYVANGRGNVPGPRQFIVVEDQGP
jgi:hypothetical protein